MGRIVGIDYGKKRTGIAVTDSLQLIANGLTTIPSEEVYQFLEQYTQKETVDTFVVGLAKQMNNEPSESMEFITPFVNGLKKRFSTIEIVFFDERFTSVLAHQTMLEGGLKKKDRQNKALVDQISATILLQSYMESRR
jgi:putative Holliday junction resolvase